MGCGGPVSTAVLTLVFTTAHAASLTLSYAVLSHVCALQVSSSSVRSQRNLTVIPFSSFPLSVVKHTACVYSRQITAAKVRSQKDLDNSVSLQLREFFTVKWNTLSFGVNKMCTYKIWKCMVAGDCLRAIPICCQEC